MDQRWHKRENCHPCFPQLHLHFTPATALALDTTMAEGLVLVPVVRAIVGIPFFLLLRHSTTMLNKL